MATVKEMSVTLGRTISQNYNSTRVEIGETITIEAGEDSDAAYREMCIRVLGRLNAIAPVQKAS